jgi:Ca-activated chloride channel homolog
MRSRNPDPATALGRLRCALLGAALVLIVAACASTSTAPTSSGESAGAGGGPLEEVVVTSSRVSGRGGPAPSVRRSAPAAESSSSPSASTTQCLECFEASQRAGSSSSADASTAFADGLRRMQFNPPEGGGAPLSRARPGEEIWVIETAAARAADAVDDDSPGSGTLLALLPRAAPEPVEVPLPLEHTDVHAVVTGYVGTVDVTQQFTNPYDEKIEAVYLFPLPEKAAVSEFVMTIGERRIRGILREKEEAEAIYRDARAQGYRASLLVQRRPNVFEQKVANIEPGRGIDVSIRYYHTLAYEDGWYSFVFPTVVGPRYNPAGSRDPLEAVPRDDVRERTAGTAVRYLRPTERSAHDLGIAVDLDAGVAIEALDASHAVRTERDGPTRARVELAAGDTMPNRDFVLRFRVAGGTIKSNLLTYRDAETGDGYFSLMVYPPAGLEALPRRAVEMVFVIDTSGSMSGRPLAQATAAVAAALDRLGDDDTFEIMNFSNQVARLAPEPLRATAANRALGRDYLRRLGGAGGTEMLSGIRAALSFDRDPERPRYVTFLTDGYIGNEAEVLGEVHRSIGDARIFSFGVGSAVNRYLLDGLATEGRGAAAYLGQSDSAEEIMAFYFDRISHPALTDLRIDWNGLDVSEVYPRRLPDLFVGRPVVVTGKYRGASNGVVVHGRAGLDSVDVGLGRATRGQPALRNLWARQRIEDLSRQQTWSPDAYARLEDAIRATALTYGLMSAYTAFVAVDASERTRGARGTTVNQAVPVPDGVRYETSVADR